MTTRKTDGWPIVTPDDDGIRPAGRPDECFYCNRRVGQPHRQCCVTVLKIMKYSVWVEGERVGTFQREEPYSWSPEECESHKNESSWCVGNALADIQWEGGGPPEGLFEEGFDVAEDFCCMCGVLGFRFEEVVEAGPLVEVREVACTSTT